MAGENGATQRSTDSDVEKAISEADKREFRSEAEFVFAYDESKNVLKIERDPLYKAALNEWDRKATYLSKRVDRREKASADLVNQVFQLVGFFCVFQGVVLSAVTTLKSDTFATCGLLWFPIVLTSTATVVSIVGVSLKFKNLVELEELIVDVKTAQTEATKRGDRLRRDGIEDFRFYTSAEDPVKIKGKKFFFNWFYVVLSLVLFTALLILSYFAILCNSFVIHPWNGGLNRP